MHLSSVQSTETFITLLHPRFPNHQVRIKKSDFCDPTVNVYTGYLDVDQGAKHLFFYFFESRRNPDEDDVMLWINGGPGCSSSLGLLMELGPSKIDMTNETNIFFLDQPVGVGFSYADYGEVIETTEDAAKNGRRLHLAGESYGGRHLPVFASEIVDQNAIAKAEGRDTLNLKSVLIGNGATDISTFYSGRVDVECGTASLETPVRSISACVRMRQTLPRCTKALQDSCIDTFDEINCNAANLFCNSELSVGYLATGLNPYDMTKTCEAGLEGLCYEEDTAIEEYLNQPSVRSLLGVTAPQNFSSCSDDIGIRFESHLDLLAQPTQQYVAELLARDVRVLIYVGTYDWICNRTSNRIAAGITKSAGQLTFASVYGAGYMVPFDKPAEALKMVSRWISEEPL
ncbi:hypothetical protein ACEPAH_3644 [Sanghuangporus vaninii]